MVHLLVTYMEQLEPPAGPGTPAWEQLGLHYALRDVRPPSVGSGRTDVRGVTRGGTECGLTKGEGAKMGSRRRITVDGNEAAASVAYRASETIAIYPITPSSPMAEVCDEWSSRKKPNLWGAIPELAEMQSEGGRRRRRPWRAPGRRARDHLHRVAGPAADDPQHVQDRRRADAVRDARRRADARDARAVDLRRPLRRDGLPPDRLRAPVLELGAGGARHGRRGARRDARDAHSRSCTSSTASGRRTRSRRSRS